MKCKSKVDGGYFRLNEKGKWVKVNAPVQEELDFGKIKGGNMKKLVLINGNAVQAETVKLHGDIRFYTVEKATYQGVEYDYLEIPISSVLFFAREKEEK